MADTAVTVRDVPMDAFSESIAAQTAISAGNTAVIDAGGVTTKLLVIATNTTDAKSLTVAAGVGPRAALGNLVQVFGATQTRHIVIESARFAGADGKVRVTFEGAGSIAAYRLPPGS